MHLLCSSLLSESVDEQYTDTMIQFKPFTHMPSKEALNTAHTCMALISAIKQTVSIKHVFLVA